MLTESLERSRGTQGHVGSSRVSQELEGGRRSCGQERFSWFLWGGIGKAG